jgi:Tfp pilus assembly protein PilW
VSATAHRTARAGSCARASLRRAIAGEAGYTIAELIVAAFLATFVLTVVFAAVRVQGRGAALQTGVADTQLTARGAGELLTEDLRMAGYGMLGVAPEEDLPPLEVTVTGGVVTMRLRANFSDVSTSLAAAAAAGSSSLTVTPPTNGGVFQVGNLVLVDSGLSSEVKTITSVGTSGGNITVGLSSALDHAYPIGPEVTQIEVVTYTYGSSILRRNGQVVADNASTVGFQFVDHVGNVTADPGENVRSVILNLVALQPSKLPDNPTASSSVVTEANLRNLAFRFSLS